jgi:hypothetical protein
MVTGTFRGPVNQNVEPELLSLMGSYQAPKDPIVTIDGVTVELQQHRGFTGL